MKRMRVDVALLTPEEAAKEAEELGATLPPLESGCVWCFHGSGTPGFFPGTQYMRLGWVDGGSPLRAPPVYAPVCDTCLEL